MTSDSKEIIKHSSIKYDIEERIGALAVLKNKRRIYPLYEGKMMWYFDHRYGTYEGQTQKQANQNVLPHVSEIQHSDPYYQIEPQYWVDADLVNTRLQDDHSAEYFYSWRDVGPNSRTFVGTIVPKSAFVNKAPNLFCDKEPIYFNCLVSILSSIVVDYSLRQRTNMMKLNVVEQIPILTPEQVEFKHKWLGKSYLNWVVNHMIELNYTNFELHPYALDLEYNTPPYIWNSERRAIIQSEIDAVIMHLYNLDLEQVEWILDSFDTLCRFEEKELGEFRTKRLVLQEYDRISNAKESGIVYQSTLNPLPGDERLCYK